MKKEHHLATKLGKEVLGSGVRKSKTVQSSFSFSVNGKFGNNIAHSLFLPSPPMAWILLPSGGILTLRGLQLLGLTGLGSSTGFEHLHYMFERVWDPVIVLGAQKQISYYFLNLIFELCCEARMMCSVLVCTVWYSLLRKA
ncbi:unnamed protein product, partial [Ilex paraguariensis]